MESTGHPLVKLNDSVAATELLVCCGTEQNNVALVERLRGLGFRRVTHVAGGGEALDLIGVHPPRLLLTDLVLSDMKFWAFVRTLRSGQAYPGNLPIVALTPFPVSPVDLVAGRENSVWIFLDEQETDLQDIVVTALTGMPKLKLLLIEDDREFASLLGKRLIGYDVSIESCGAKGLATFEENDFDIVVLDLRLPDMDGEEVLEGIFARNPCQIVIVATGDAGRDIYLLRSGADQFLVKPLTVQKVQSACDRLWRQASNAKLLHAANTLKDHLFLANECLLSGKTGRAHSHILEGLDLDESHRTG